jgi:ribosomal protein L7Ae-like RNA K-turn-binding protein
MMNMARKSGQFITGSGKVEDAVRSGAARALMHASDAAEDGVRKLRQANTARAKGDKQAEIPVFRLFSADELSLAMGEGAFIHAAALAGQAGEGVVKRAKILARYRNGPDAGPWTENGLRGVERPDAIDQEAGAHRCDAASAETDTE